MNANPGTPITSNPFTADFFHANNLSSDNNKEGGLTNLIGRITLHCYNYHSHIRHKHQDLPNDEAGGEGHGVGKYQLPPQ